MKEKLHRLFSYVKRHKLSMLVLTFAIVYYTAKLIRIEVRGTELLLEPMIEVIIVRFIGGE